jgi:hypothetical protein
MSRLSVILFLLATIEVYGQIDVFPKYRPVDIYTVESKNIRFVKSIEISNDTISIEIGSMTYRFVSSIPDTTRFSYPRFLADFNDKFNLEISSWEIVNVEPEYLRFKVSYTKRLKTNGGQKGKYYTIDNLKIERDKIIGLYYPEDIKQRKIGWVELTLLALIATVSFLVGDQ